MDPVIGGEVGETLATWQGPAGKARSPWERVRRRAAGVNHPAHRGSLIEGEPSTAAQGEIRKRG